MVKQQLQRIMQRAIWSWEGFVHVYRTEGSLSQWLVANGVFAVLAFALPCLCLRASGACC